MEDKPQMSEPSVLDPQHAYALWAASYPPHAHNPLMLAEQRAMLELLPADLRGCNVLDVGCGSGRYILHARRRGAARVVGIDISGEMLSRAQTDVMLGQQAKLSGEQKLALARAGVEALPIENRWADVTLCGLTLGHLPALAAPLAELSRVTRSGGLVLCSDFHPAGEALGWKRIFRVGGRHYAVRHTSHALDAWRPACQNAGLRVVRILEPCLDPADIPPDARFDRAGLEIPVALVLALSNEKGDRIE